MANLFNPLGLPALAVGLAQPEEVVPQTSDLDSLQLPASQRGDWGIFRNGVKVLEPDSIVGFDYRGEWRVADFPIEEGEFRSYDKVVRPYEVRLRMTKGGDQAARGDFLDKLEEIAASLDLYDVVTPEITYLSANVECYSYARQAQSGVGLLTVEVSLREIRLAKSPTSTVVQLPTFQNVQTPAAKAVETVGTVQPTIPPLATQAAVKAAVKKAIAPPASAAGAPQ
jgi:hypothetical protein